MGCGRHSVWSSGRPCGRGVRLVLADAREEALESAADSLWSSGAEVIFVSADVSDADPVKLMGVVYWRARLCSDHHQTQRSYP